MTQPAAPLYYSCEHGSSNTPDACQLRAWAFTSQPGDPLPATMPDDWWLTYPSLAGGGMSDSYSVQ